MSVKELHANMLLFLKSKGSSIRNKRNNTPSLRKVLSNKEVPLRQKRKAQQKGPI